MEWSKGPILNLNQVIFFLCPQPARGPYLGIKCHDETSPSKPDSLTPALISLQDSLLLVYCFSILMVSLIFFKQLSISASGYLHLLLPLPECSFPDICVALVHTSFKSSFKCHLLVRAFPDHTMQKSTPRFFCGGIPLRIWHSSFTYWDMIGVSTRV